MEAVSQPDRPVAGGLHGALGGGVHHAADRGGDRLRQVLGVGETAQEGQAEGGCLCGIEAVEAGLEPDRTDEGESHYLRGSGGLQRESPADRGAFFQRISGGKRGQLPEW